MQVKKDEVRFAILFEAEIEFLEKGYSNASLRKIVKQAGTSIGNFYNYFESKGMLFEELVNEEYENFLYFFQNHDHMSKGIDDNLEQSTIDKSQWRKVLSQGIQPMLPNLSVRFVILMEGSQGTRFENTRLKCIEMVQEHFLEHARGNELNDVKTNYAAIVSEQFLDGLLLIIKKQQDEVLRQKVMTEHILFYMMGALGLMEDWRATAI